MKQLRNLWAGAAVCAVALALAAAGAGAKPTPAQATGAFVVTGAKTKTLSDVQAAAAQKTTTRGAKSPDKKTLIFHGKSVRLVVATGPEDDMLSYRIGGLKNPTISVAPGTLLRILFINTDEDMTHDLRFTSHKAPFDTHVDRAGTTGSALLAHRAAKSLHAEELSVRAPTRRGRYSYLCTVPGHAAGGMYGAIVVR
jgi:rusticyanin